MEHGGQAPAHGPVERRQRLVKQQAAGSTTNARAQSVTRARARRCESTSSRRTRELDLARAGPSRARSP